ncbi:hypothetical protein M2281_000894 [Mesorhizobium soli]|uniref:ATP-binding protein n=1 Tax=Pseudaminobacter soli (ex Li et al. 2025) TaxID=1295366 RepID=UPI002475DF7F|nr:ATP-grasp domain-containing protein [Mesorhizobium soli]MDH6230322.1 hypothetical protein [Mesorhizobium soli]
MKEAGFGVGVLAPKGSLIHSTRYIDEKFILGARGFEPIIRRGIKNAFEKFAPDIIVPCDEQAAAIVSHWVEKGAGTGRLLPPQLLQCLERSLGAAEGLSQRASKPETLAKARAVGVVCPRETIVEDFSHCQKVAVEYGYPVVLKLSRGVGGYSVRVCNTKEELNEAFRRYKRSQWRSNDLFRRLIRQGGYKGRLDIVVQEHVSGRPGISCASAINGTTVSVLTGLVETARSQTGPATVVRLTNQPSIVDATVKMIAAFGASGFMSFDFIVDDQGQAHLIECNPRPTQMAPLGPLVGVDLAGALLKTLQDQRHGTGYEVPTGEQTISLFPQEWSRDPFSPSLQATYHDVPWDDATLLAALIGKVAGQKQRRRFLWRGRSEGRAHGARPVTITR